MYLSHWTKTLDNLISIIENGFVFFPNERKVFAQLLNESKQGSSEPQCRGMVCFTDVSIHVIQAHSSKYGDYGIGIDRKWAMAHGACKTMYIGEKTPTFSALAELFKELKPTPPATGDAALNDWLSKLATTRPEFAKSMGSAAYANLLTLHEYMQSDEDIAESEWRVIRPHRFAWSEGSTLSDIKRACLKMSLEGILPTLRADRQATVFLACPMGSSEDVRNRLQGEWKSIDIFEIECDAGRSN